MLILGAAQFFFPSPGAGPTETQVHVPTPFLKGVGSKHTVNTQYIYNSVRLTMSVNMGSMAHYLKSFCTCLSNSTQGCTGPKIPDMNPVSTLIFHICRENPLAAIFHLIAITLQTLCTALSNFVGAFHS